MTKLTDDDLAMAAEVALGLLSPADLAQAQARMTRDDAFAREVADWQDRLIPLTDGPDAAPPAKSWQAIEAAIMPSTNQDNRLWLWKGMTAVSTFAAALMGFLLVSQDVPPATPHDILVAALGGPAQSASLTASYDQQSGELTLTPVTLDTGKLFPELWVIPAGGTASSLGIIRADGPSRVTVDAQLRRALANGATLAITPEPGGGAPGGKATGPILASGTITTI